MMADLQQSTRPLPHGLPARGWLKRERGLVLPKQEIIKCPAILHEWDEVPLEAVIGTPTTLGSGGEDLTGAASFAITTSGAISAGYLVVVPVLISNFVNSSITVASVNDGTNAYSKAVGVSTSVGGDYYGLELWFVANAKAVGSSASLTVTYSAASSHTLGIAVAAQASGIAAASPYDSAGNTGTGSGTSVSVATSTLPQAVEIVWGCNFNDNGVAYTYTESAGFTNLYNNSDPAATGFGLSLGYKIVASTAAVTHAPSFSSPGPNWLDIAAPFKGLVVSGMAARRIVYRRKH
jgi:hypothetical protein